MLALTASMGACTTNPSTGRSQLLLISEAQVAQMGIEAKPQLTAEYGGEVENPQLRAYIDKVGRGLLNHIEPEYAKVEWEFTLLDSDVINAFALPGGKVFFSRGLLERFANEAQVAGVLGHEIGHVTAKHVDERVSQGLLAQLGLELINAVSETELVSAGAQLLAQGTILKFGRDQELEADRQGLKYMVRAGYNPDGMAEVLKILIDASKGSQPLEILSTHPNPERRLAMVRNLMATEYKYAVDNAEFKKYQGRFAQEAKPHLKPPAEAPAGEAKPRSGAGGGLQRRGVVPANWCAICALASAGPAQPGGRSTGRVPQEADRASLTVSKTDLSGLIQPIAQGLLVPAAGPTLPYPPAAASRARRRRGRPGGADFPR
jgi:predicted Zn-dependent protease